MDFYNSFNEFCEKNNLTRSQGIEILEKELKEVRQDGKQHF